MTNSSVRSNNELAHNMQFIFAPSRSHCRLQFLFSLSFVSLSSSLPRFFAVDVASSFVLRFFVVRPGSLVPRIFVVLRSWIRRAVVRGKPRLQAPFPNTHISCLLKASSKPLPLPFRSPSALGSLNTVLTSRGRRRTFGKRCSPSPGPPKTFKYRITAVPSLGRAHQRLGDNSVLISSQHLSKTLPVLGGRLHRFWRVTIRLVCLHSLPDL